MLGMNCSLQLWKKNYSILFENSSDFGNNMGRGFFETLCIKKMFLEILQNSQENTCTKVFFIKVAGFKKAF